MNSTNDIGPHQVLAPARVDVTEPAAAPDCKRWRLEISGARLTVQAWNDASTWHDTIVLERRGAMLSVKLPVMADLRAILQAYPQLQAIAPIIIAKRRLVEAGAPGDMGPQLIHTKTAAACWPIFGMAEPCPLAGGASFFDVMAVWAPALDQFLPDPDAN